ncbi:hypothetical protein ACP70R_023483 [Stipagrostis hirtigluma subsp. patula]
MQGQGFGDNFQKGWIIGGVGNDYTGLYSKGVSCYPRQKQPKSWFPQPPGAFSYSYAYAPPYHYPPPQYPPYGYSPPMAGGGCYGCHEQGYAASYAANKGSYGNMGFQDGHGQLDSAVHAEHHNQEGTKVNTGSQAGGAASFAVAQGHGQHGMVGQNTGQGYYGHGYNAPNVPQQGGYGANHNYSGAHMSMGGAGTGDSHGQHDTSHLAQGHYRGGAHTNTGLPSGHPPAAAAASGYSQHETVRQSTGSASGGGYYGHGYNTTNVPQQGGYGTNQNYGGAHMSMGVPAGGAATGASGGAAAAAAAAANGHSQHEIVRQNTGSATGGGFHGHGYNVPNVPQQGGYGTKQNYGGAQMSMAVPAGGVATGASGGAAAAAAATNGHSQHETVRQQNTGSAAGGAAAAAAAYGPGHHGTTQYAHDAKQCGVQTTMAAAAAAVCGHGQA